VRGHVDSETLAAFREGLLPRRKAGRVAAHLARCAQCAGLDAQLAELPALLAHSPAPPMPAALTARIEAALAAEAAARSATADKAAGASDGATAVPGHRKTLAPGPGRSRLALRVAAVTAAVVVLAGGGYGLSRLLAGGATQLPPTGSAAHAAMGPTEPRPAVGGARQRASSSNGLAGPRIVRSGTNYQPGQLKTQVRKTLARFGPGVKLAAPAATPLGHSVSLANLPACQQRFGAGRHVELVDEARYEGRPAAIIVMPGASAGTLRVLVVPARCSAAAAGPIFSTILPGPG
jgi:hypothetical protein